ncbi:hypothetical protein LIA77_04581 [Sarocladium implicatum]|nr:hypothetical protein LIA77_04581 [Sarocladium implicatum]
MAVLGKRKARAAEAELSRKSSGPATGDDAQSVQDIFRRHFEAQFAPLPESSSTRAQRDAESEEDDESGSDEEDEAWGGLSDGDEDDGVDENEEEDNDESDGGEIATLAQIFAQGLSANDVTEGGVVEVVDHSSHAPTTSAMSRAELKAFMSSRPPDPTASTASKAETQTSKKSKTLPEDAPSLLAQDLELRRLISESHLLAPKPTPSLRALLDPSSSSTAAAPKLFTDGRTRRKATDLRLQALGSKTSIYKQEKMPMNMRKGMVAARVEGEKKRRREAKENGVVLERERSDAGVKKAKKKKDFGVDRPGIGRMKGAQLRISDRDIKSIENTRDTFGRKRR